MLVMYITLNVLCIGLLCAVTGLDVNVLDSVVSTMWNPPWTLNILGVNPDIEYCVDVMTPTSSLITTCSINTTDFSYLLPPDSGCHDYYELTVTPVNIVGNGTPSSLNYSNTITTRKL